MDTNPVSISGDERILLLTPSGRDSEVVANVLRAAGLQPVICADMDMVCDQAELGAGAAVIAEEALNARSVETLACLLQKQPTWSALPVLVMTSGGEATDLSQRRLDLLAPIGNPILLERPLRIATFRSSVESALRARRHQYEIRNHIEQQASERRVLEMVANAQDLTDILHTICQLTEAQVPGSICCVLVWDSIYGSLRNAASPSLPALGRTLCDMPAEALDLAGLFGAEPLVIDDLANDPQFGAVGRIAASVNFRGLWSRPMRTRTGELLGLFHLYQKEAFRTPSAEELSRRDAFANLATLATERHRIEDHLRQSEERYRTLAESLPQLVWTCLPDGNCDYLSSQWVACTGIPEADQLGLRWLEVIHPDDRERTREAWMAAVRDEAPYDLDYRLRRYDGVFRWFKTRGTPVRDTNGRIVKWFGSCTDIQDLRDARDAVGESEERFRTMANSAPVLIWTSATDKRCDFFNEPWLRFTGRTMKDEIENGWTARVHPDDLKESIETYSASFDQSRSFTMEYRMLRYDGEWRWLLDHGVPRFSPQGDFQGYIGCCIDITDRRAAEETLRATNRELEEFAYVASHDLQEPLRTVKLYSQLLLNRFGDTQSEEAQTFVSFIRSSVERMENLIHDLLSYSRTVHGEIAELKEVDLNHTFQRAVDLLDGHREEARAIVTHDPLPVVRADGSQLEQVLQNLLSNALKYRKPAEPPHIHVAARRAEGHWVITVSDNGIGFDQKYADKVFGLFRRLHRDEYPGTGIGLAICKRILERIGGTIWAEAEPGRGAKFHFTIPIPDAEEARRTPVLTRCAEDSV